MLTWCQAQTLEHFQCSLPCPFGHDLLDFGDSSSHFGLPRWLRWERICLQCRKPGFDPQVVKISWRREWLLFQYSYWDNPMERDAWWTSVHGVTVGHDWVTERMFPLYPLCWDFFFFIINECGILSKAFFWIFWEDHSISIFQFANVICNSDRFAAIESFLHSWDQSTWLWYMIFSGYCRVQFVNICWGFLNLCSSETLTSSVVPLAFY